MGITIICLVMAILYLPILFLVGSSFAGGWTYYQQLFTTSEYMEAVRNTLLIAVIASLVATIIASMAATGILYMSKRTRAITMAVNQLPVINADIVTSFGLVLLFVSVGMTNLGLLKLLLAHVLIALPFCLLTILPKMRQLDANLIDAALDLGASPFKAFTSVIVPQLVPAMVQAFLLGFTLSLDDFVITQYNNSGVPTISTVVYGAISRRDIPKAFYALTTIIFIVILLVLIVMNLNAARVRKGIKISRKVTAVALAAVILLATGGLIPMIISHFTPRELVLKVYNWEDYIASTSHGAKGIDYDLLEEFEAYYRDVLKEKGVKNADKFRVEYHTFTDNEELYSKINTQHSDYDVIFPSEYMVEKMANENLIQPIDTTLIYNYADLDNAIMQRTSDFTAVDGNTDQAWAIPYMVGTVGIMYDRNVIDAMAEKMPEDKKKITADDFEALLEEYGFGVLFGEGGTDVFKGHITMKKSARDSIGIAMIYGAQKQSNDEHKIDDSATYLANIENDDDNTLLSNILNMDGDYKIDLANEILMEQIRVMNPLYENDNGKKGFEKQNNRYNYKKSNGTLAYGLYWSCDAGLTMMAVDEEHEDDEEFENPLRFYAPQGTNLWTDNFAIPTYAENLDAAYAFINFMLDDENAARNIDYVGSQMVSTGDEIDLLKASYYVPGYTPIYENDDEENGEVIDFTYDPAETDADPFEEYDVNLAIAVFPSNDNIKYSAIMHNFDQAKENGVNNLMLDVQNKAAELTEDSSSGNLFLIVLAILVIAAFAWWGIYKLLHRRPRQLPDTVTTSQK
ncbi:MAG: extracellular solute-binding protein [Eubacteriales bacterium]|nr:extracellular solute-binding protein [Eubacteriales bacterium]